MQPEPLKLLLELAGSEAWEDRANAAAKLVRVVDSHLAARVMLDLLCDAHNTAVGQAALDALLARGDGQAMDILFEGVGLADEDMAEHLLYFIARDHSREPERSRIVGFARRRAMGRSGPVQDGATAILDYLDAGSPPDG